MKLDFDVTRMMRNIIAGKHVAKPFRHNVGTSEIVDRDIHPYFRTSVEAKELQLSAVKNYGMKSAKTIYEEEDLATYSGKIRTKMKYRQDWRALERKYNKGILNEGFTIVDNDRSISAHFDADLMKKMIKRGRHTFFDEVELIIEDPDEVWGVRKSGTHYNEELFNVYIRYYEDTPMILLINSDGRVDSLYKWERGVVNFEEFRSGVLKYRKR